MHIAALVARLLLALVFVVAGSAKLMDRKGSRRALIDFGFPTALASPLGILLPLAELAVAATLLPTATAPWGALGALTLLLLFIAGIGLSLARGRKPDCHCFGQIHSAPAGWKTLARNGVLAAIAGFLVWQGWEGDIGPSALSWIGTLSPVQLLGLVVGVLGLLAGQWWLVHLSRQDGRFSARLRALKDRLATGGAAPSRNGVSNRPAESSAVETCGNTHPGMPAARKIGEPAPKIEIRDPVSGAAVNLWSIKGEETLVLFWDPECVFCQQMLPDLKQWEEDPPEGAPMLLVISAGAEDTGLESPVLFDHSFAVFWEFGASETPSAMLVDAEGKVASEVAVGAPEVLELARAPKGSLESC